MTTFLEQGIRNLLHYSIASPPLLHATVDKFLGRRVVGKHRLLAIYSAFVNEFEQFVKAAYVPTVLVERVIWSRISLAISGQLFANEKSECSPSVLSNCSFTSHKFLTPHTWGHGAIPCFERLGS